MIRAMSKRLPLLLVSALSLAASAPAFAADVSISIHFDVAPPLVEVSPGVQVVPDYDEEVFFRDGWYWTRRDDVWYRTKDYHGGWASVGVKLVPVEFVKIPPGHYKHWHADKDDHDHDGDHDKHDHDDHGKGHGNGKHGH